MDKDEVLARRKVTQAKCARERAFKALRMKINYLDLLNSKKDKTHDDIKEAYAVRAQIIKKKNNVEFHDAYMDWEEKLGKHVSSFDVKAMTAKELRSLVTPCSMRNKFAAKKIDSGFSRLSAWVKAFRKYPVVGNSEDVGITDE